MVLLSCTQVYLNSFPTSPLGVNLKACNTFRSVLSWSWPKMVCNKDLHSCMDLFLWKCSATWSNPARVAVGNCCQEVRQQRLFVAFAWQRGCTADAAAVTASFGKQLRTPPLSAWLCRLQDGRAAEADLRGLVDAMGGKHTEHDLIRHNLVVFKGGEGAQQVHHVMPYESSLVCALCYQLAPLELGAPVVLHCKQPRR